MIIPLESTLTARSLSLLDILEWVVRAPVEIFHGYSSLLRWGAEAIQDLFDKYGYWVIFLGTFSENTLLVGLIVPGAIVVILSGLAAHDGSMSVPVAVALGIAGTVLGDTLSYFIGRYGWSRFGKSKMLTELSEKVREPILRRGTWFVLFYHFAGYTRVIGPTSAGLLKMPFRMWAPADYGGAGLWICAYFTIGYGLGELGLTLDSTDRWFRIIEWGLLALMGVWVYFILRAHPQLLGMGGRDTTSQTAEEEDEEREATPAQLE